MADPASGTREIDRWPCAPRALAAGVLGAAPSPGAGGSRLREAASPGARTSSCRELLLAATVFLLGACAPQAEEPARPHGIVLLMLDTVRADRLSVYGYDPRVSPALAELAARGSVFEHVQAPAPWTVPSVASLWTGLHPDVHGAGLHGEPRKFEFEQIRGFDAGLGTLPRRLSALGYRTYGYVANMLLDSECFAAGFDEWEIASRARGADFVRWVEERLAELDDRPFFLYLHFMDAHYPHQPPEELVREFLPSAPSPLPRGTSDPALRAAMYDAALRAMDDQLGSLQESLARIGVLADTLFVVTSDHGEEFGEHLELARESYDLKAKAVVGKGHGHSLFQELLRVPLVLAGPGVPRGARFEARVRLLDLGATLIDLAGGPGELGEGASFAPLLAGEPLADRPSFSSGLAYGYEQHALVDERGFKLIDSTHPGERDLLFDLRSDPAETRDLLAEQPDVAADLRRTLEGWRERPATRTLVPGAPLERVDVERLRALGYIGAEDE